MRSNLPRLLAFMSAFWMAASHGAYASSLLPAGVFDGERVLDAAVDNAAFAPMPAPGSAADGF